MSDLESELSQIGLRVHEVEADGSCFFRALADQLHGSNGDHRALRQRIVSHMKDHRDEYEPFVEDDEPFDNYIERMGEEGTWAGNMELQAGSQVLAVNLRIYQAGERPWTVKNFPEESAPLLHLSYHDGIHYNSVRLAHDYGTAPPEPIPQSMGASNGNMKQSGEQHQHEGPWSERDIKKVKEGTGCWDDSQIRAALDKAGGNVAAAIEVLVEALGHEEDAEQEDEETRARMSKEEMGNMDNETENEVGGRNSIDRAAYQGSEHKNTFIIDSNGGDDDAGPIRVDLEVSRGGKGKKVSLHLHFPNESSLGEENFQSGKKGKAVSCKGKKGALPLRNSRCPCGSTKKYKNCCGASKAARERAAKGGERSEEEDKHGRDMDGVAAAMSSVYI